MLIHAQYLFEFVEVIILFIEVKANKFIFHVLQKFVFQFAVYEVAEDANLERVNM